MDGLMDIMRFMREMKMHAEYSIQCQKGVRPTKYAIANNLNKSIKAKAVSYKLIRGRIQRNK
mgnify:CR=1 FL=1